MLGIPNQRLLRSTSKYALTDITLDFADGTGPLLGSPAGRRTPAAAWATCRRESPAAWRRSPRPGEMFMFTIEGDIDLAEKRQLLDWVIRPALRTVPAWPMSTAWAGSGPSRWSPTRRPDGPRPRCATCPALEANNRNDGAGRPADGEEARYWCGPRARWPDLADVAAVVVRSRDGRVVWWATWPRCAWQPDPLRRGDRKRSRRGRRGPRSSACGRQRPRWWPASRRAWPKSPEPAAGVRIEPFYDRSNSVGPGRQDRGEIPGRGHPAGAGAALAFLGNLRAAWWWR